MPPSTADIVERLEAARRFGEGFRTVEYLAATLLGWGWHTPGADEDPGDALAFEQRVLRRALT